MSKKEEGKPPERALSRRELLLLLATGSTALALTPFIPFGNFLNPGTAFKLSRVKIGSVDELPPNSFKTFFYPSTADPEYANLLIHLSPEKALRAGEREFVAYNSTCIHLRCLTRYLPGPQEIGCPCHGSVYRIEDGKPIKGPAARIGRKLPEVRLEIDKDGNIYATGLDVAKVGYGV